MRSRNIKPGFFKNEDLAELPYEARLLFIGLWCVADREGLFEWRPKRIKAELFPYDDMDVERHLMSLHAMTLIYKYTDAQNRAFGCIPSFHEHQRPHPHEKKSEIPKPEQDQQLTDEPLNVITSSYMSRNDTKCKPDIRNPDIRIPDIRIPDMCSNPETPNSDEFGAAKNSGDDWRAKYDQEVLAFVQRFQTHRIKHGGNKAPKITESLLRNGADTIDKLIRIDGHSLQEIKAVLKWAVNDSFWSGNVFSLAGLREKKGDDGRTKYQKILAASERTAKSTRTMPDLTAMSRPEQDEYFRNLAAEVERGVN